MHALRIPVAAQRTPPVPLVRLHTRKPLDESHCTQWFLYNTHLHRSGITEDQGQLHWLPEPNTLGLAAGAMTLKYSWSRASRLPAAATAAASWVIHPRQV